MRPCVRASVISCATIDWLSVVRNACVNAITLYLFCSVALQADSTYCTTTVITKLCFPYYVHHPGIRKNFASQLQLVNRCKASIWYKDLRQWPSVEQRSPTTQSKIVIIILILNCYPSLNYLSTDNVHANARASVKVRYINIESGWSISYSQCRALAR